MSGPSSSGPGQPSGADVIELRGLRAVGYCGVLAEEQERAQPLEVDLDVEADLTRPGATDELADTLDYGALADAVEEIVTTERFALLERLATRIADSVLDDPRALAVTVTVRKLRPPVPHHLDTSGVRIRRTR
jgi:dihydroneopterin aldolase